MTPTTSILPQEGTVPVISVSDSAVIEAKIANALADSLNFLFLLNPSKIYLGAGMAVWKSPQMVVGRFAEMFDVLFAQLPP